MSDLVAAIIVALIIIFLIWIAHKNEEKTIQKHEKIQGYMTYDPTKKEICVIKRGNVFSEILEIKKVVDQVTRYEPEKLHFGAATVGGVTTGGTYKTDGYNYVVGTRETGKYSLVYEKDAVQTIRLPPELIEAAKQSAIKEYVNSSGVIKVIPPTSGSIPDYLVGKTDLAMLYLKEQMLSNYPTREKCQAILDWLCQG